MEDKIFVSMGKVWLGLLMVLVGTINFFMDFNSTNVILILLIFGGIGTIMWGLNRTT